MQSCRSILSFFCAKPAPKATEEEMDLLIADDDDFSEKQKLQTAIQKLAVKLSLSSTQDEFDITALREKLEHSCPAGIAPSSFTPFNPVARYGSAFFTLILLAGGTLKSASVGYDGSDCKLHYDSTQLDLITECQTKEAEISGKLDTSSNYIFAATGAVATLLSVYHLSKQVKKYQLEKLYTLCNEYQELMQKEDSSYSGPLPLKFS